MRTPAELSDAFRRQGLKVTPQRQLLFRLLHDNPSHPTAECLYAEASAEMPGISLRTVYQTLNDLVSMGELRQVPASGGAAARFDANTTHHHHAHCDSCGALHDVYVRDLDGLHVDGAEGFRVRTANIVFNGVCASCAGN